MLGSKSRILVVDDEPHITQLVASTLIFGGHNASVAHSGVEALEMIKGVKYDMIILDIMMPGMNGFELAEKIKELEIFVPIVFLTAKDSTGDIEKGYGIGAEYYITKPFDINELLARVSTLLRRTKNKKIGSSIVNYKSISLDKSSGEVLRNGEVVKLSGKEFLLLRYFMLNAGESLSRAVILRNALESGESKENVLESHVSQLRKKISIDENDPEIKTVRSVGYMFI